MVAIACPERYVVGLDISENAIKKATDKHELKRGHLQLDG